MGVGLFRGCVPRKCFAEMPPEVVGDVEGVCVAVFGESGCESVQHLENQRGC